MMKGDVLLGFEESGGIGFPGHIPERDGILAGLMLLELLATERLSVNELIARLEQLRPTDRGGQCPHPAGQQHHGGKRPAVDRGTFHQSPDHPQVFRRPIRFHRPTLYYKVKNVKPFPAASERLF